MVIVAVLTGTLVLFGFVALATDGGNLLLQRRNMQNAADAAAIGAVKILSENVVWGPDPADNINKPIYVVTDGQLKDLIRLLADRNGIKAGSYFSIKLEYGDFDETNCDPYCWDTLPITGATNLNGTWVPPADPDPSAVVPSQVDAVRITAQIDYPTTFARIIGWNTITASAVSAAALVGDPDYVVKGPTWPMTSFLSGVDAQDYLNNYAGLCKPTVFYNKSVVGGPIRFENLTSLAAAQGCSFTQDRVYSGDCSSEIPPDGLHGQLINKQDSRLNPQGDPGLQDVAFDLFNSGRRNQTVCNSTQSGWFPQGSCSGTLDAGRNINEKFGTMCCRHNPTALENRDLDVSDIDVPNWIYWDFFGKIKPEEGVFPGGNSVPGDVKWPSLDINITEPQDYRSADWPPNEDDPSGDWVETYLSWPQSRIGNRSDLVIRPVSDQINRINKIDALASAIGLDYGPHIDKTMYLYDKKEYWRLEPTEPPDPPGPTPTGTPIPTPTFTPTSIPRYAWQSAPPAEIAPDRVHAVQPFKFRFYRTMARDQSNWTFNLHPLCTEQLPPYTVPAVVAIIVGEVLDQPPAVPYAHGMYNYVGFVDANQ